jgi:hypothetical protein
MRLVLYLIIWAITLAKTERGERPYGWWLVSGILVLTIL